MDNSLWYGYEDQPYKSSPKHSKSKKSNHKHVYKPCLIDDKKFLWQGKYCIKCGRLQITSFLWDMISTEDQKNLPKFIVDNIWKDKYISFTD